jgi:hypothetical protein
METMKSVVLTALLLATVPAGAQEAKMRVAVQCKVGVDDSIGARVCTAVRDGLASSPRYALVGMNAYPEMVIHITTLRESDILSAQAVAYTFVIPPKTEDFLTLGAAQTGRDMINTTASNIIAALDGLQQ